MNKINWKLLILIGLTGPLLALAGNFGYVSFDAEPFVALGIFLVASILFSVFKTGKYFMHGFLAALLFGFLMTMIRLKFMQQYINTNPDSIDKGESFMQWVHYVRSIKTILFSLILISGAISGILAWGVHLILRLINPGYFTLVKNQE